MKIRFRSKWVLLAVAALAFPASVLAGVTRIAAFGDTPYFMPQDGKKFERLIRQVNELKPDFAVHVGDIKSGSSLCSDENLLNVFRMFGLFTTPLVYTPGDNEWTDCHRLAAGGYDPLERLAFVRKTFFPDDRSLGQAKIKLSRQSANPETAKFVENARWSLNGTVFATVHIVGSNNNNGDNDKARAEYHERLEADLAWIAAAFAQAEEQKSRAVVLFTQADMFYKGTPEAPVTPESVTGYQDLLAALRKHASVFAGQILFVHGDSHEYLLDQPLQDGSGKTLANFTRLEVYGSPDVRGVQIVVDSEKAMPFAITPMAPLGE